MPVLAHNLQVNAQSEIAEYKYLFTEQLKIMGHIFVSLSLSFLSLTLFLWSFFLLSHMYPIRWNLLRTSESRLGPC